jgi:hypothetical protein
MQTIHTEIRIRASPERVWNALAGSPAIPGEIRTAIAERKIGVNMKVAMSTGDRSATLTVKLITVDPFREVKWKGYFHIPGLFDGEHRFEIREETPGTTLLVHSEKFTGLLLIFLTGTLNDTKREFETMNADIRDRAEQSTTRIDIA